MHGLPIVVRSGKGHNVCKETFISLLSKWASRLFLLVPITFSSMAKQREQLKLEKILKKNGDAYFGLLAHQVQVSCYAKESP